MRKISPLKVIQKGWNKICDGWLHFMIFVMGLVSSAVAFAGDPTLGGGDFGQVAQKLQGEASSMKTFLWTGSQVAGIVIAIGGINMWVKASKHEDSRHSHGRAMMITLLGSLMFFLPTLMGVGASSLLND